MKSLQSSLDGDMGPDLYGSTLGGQFYESEDTVPDLPQEDLITDRFSPSSQISSVGFNPRITDFRPQEVAGSRGTIEVPREGYEDPGDTRQDRQNNFVIMSSLFGALTIISALIFV